MATYSNITCIFAATTLLAASACTVAVPGDNSSNGACDSTETTGPCEGTFSCGNSGIQGVCDMATEVCVVAPGMVYCATVASGGACPSANAAASAGGCTTPATPMCSGSSSTGITVTCNE